MKKENKELAWAIFQALYATVNFFSSWVLILSTVTWLVLLFANHESESDFTLNYISIPAVGLVVLTDLMLKRWPIKSEA